MLVELITPDSGSTTCLPQHPNGRIAIGQVLMLLLHLLLTAPVQVSWLAVCLV